MRAVNFESRMKKLLFLILVLFSVPTFAEVPNIVALVNDQPLTKYDFDNRRRMIMLLNNIQNPPAHIQEQISKAALQSLIDEQVLFQHAAKVGSKTSEGEIQGAIQTVENRNNMAPGQLAQMFKSNNVDFGSFRAQMKAELIKMNILSYLSKSVTVTPKEIDATIFTNTSKDAKISAKVFISKDKSENTLKKMYGLQKKLKGCNSIKESLYSSFAAKVDIEDSLNKLDRSVSSFVKDLRTGQASGVFETTEGFKIVLLCSKELIGISAEENTYVVNFLNNKKLSQKAQKLFTDLRRRAYIKILIAE